MAPRYCQSFPCSNLAAPGSAYCAEHRRPPAEKKADAFYNSPRWRHFRDWYLRKHPLCEHCLDEGRITMAGTVDHIMELKDGGAECSEENAQALCRKCHGTKTALAKNHRKSAARDRGCSIGGT